jgi:hypothetical protein
MITINNQEPRNVIAAVLGEFTLKDVQELESAVEHALKFQGDANLLVDLRDMAGFTLDVAWEDIRFTRKHAYDFKRIALVTGSEWQEWSAWITRMFTQAEMQVFEDYDEAVTWIQGT